MKTRELGKSGISVSELGLGCMSLPTNRNEVDGIVSAALDAGITFFDTADLYEGGENEEVVGHAIRNRREEIILSTKVGNKMNPDGKTWHWDSSKEHIIEGVKASLKRLGTNYIDLYQLHGGTMDDNFEEVVEAFERLKDEGVIRQYGISSIRPNVIQRFLNESSAVSIMMQYNMLDRRPEEWFQMIADNNASVVVRGTLAKGLLTAEGEKRAALTDSFVKYEQPTLGETVKKLTANTKNLHATAIHFCLRNDAVATTLVGARTRQQLMDSVHAYETPVSNESLEALTKFLALNQYEQHRI
ncbi:aldo/keto reductase [Sporosarcina sp. BI001-red]|uniref:aldo/keto reductase n=1 Tax=Sporosarcina sp. BI001-red TaxID=2282866 RepID=UPI000E22669E|nr:aldo/keto reductase [Sporosarcina sp. BI001-red]REB09852.1 aldo/keto reductase [Sporosarcina sp. BI001-red]